MLQGERERKRHFSSASTYLCLVPQDIAQVPDLLKVAAFALELPGTRHMGFFVKKK